VDGCDRGKRTDYHPFSLSIVGAIFFLLILPFLLVGLISSELLYKVNTEFGLDGWISCGGIGPISFNF
jgi:hypothetical protein